MDLFAVFCEHPGSIMNGKILLVGVIGKYEYRPYVKNVWHNQQIEYHCDKVSATADRIPLRQGDRIPNTTATR